MGGSKLYDVVHDYTGGMMRCNFRDTTGETTGYYESWEQFKYVMIMDDPTYNMVIRWDWDAGDKELILHYMHQRKGDYVVRIIKNMKPEDEPDVREFLQAQWDYMKTVWEPLS
jgi:hypothetical protein